VVRLNIVMYTTNYKSECAELLQISTARNVLIKRLLSEFFKGPWWHRHECCAGVRCHLTVVRRTANIKTLSIMQNLIQCHWPILMFVYRMPYNLTFKLGVVNIAKD
jgi:hypothetical protein